MCARGGYRSTNIDEITITDDGKISMVNATRKGVSPITTLNPFETQQAETIACQGGIETVPADATSKYYGSGNQALNIVKSGSWIAVRNVDFGKEGASSFTTSVMNNSRTPGVLKIVLDTLEGEAQGYCVIPSSTDEAFNTVTCTLDKNISGIHDVYFIFAGNKYQIDTWKFNK